MACIAVPEPAERDQPAFALADVVLGSLLDADDAMWDRAGRRPPGRSDGRALRARRAGPEPAPGARARPVSSRDPTTTVRPVFRPVPPDADFVALEQAELARWARRTASSSARWTSGRGAEPWVFYEGPPTANGRPGLHHVWARVYKDLFCRYRTMRGYYVARRAGWDTHGLPVEVEVEKQLGITGKRQIEDEVGIAEFTRLCRESVLDYVDEWHAADRRGSATGSTSTPPTGRFDPTYIESVWWHLQHLFDQGLLYEDLKVVPVLPALRHGAVEPRAGPARRLHRRGGRVGLRALPARRPRPRGRRRRARRSVVWTTTPWTLLSNTGVAVQPRPDLRRGRRPGRGRGRWSTTVFGDGRGRHDTGASRGRPGRPALPPTLRRRRGTGRRRRLAGGAGRLRHHRGGDRARPPGPGLRRDRPPGRPGARAAHAQPGRARRQLHRRRRLAGRPGGRARRTATSTTAWRRPGSWSAASPTSTPTRTAGGAGPRSSTGASRAGTSPPPPARTTWSRRTEAVDWHPAYIRDGRFGEWLANNVDWALSRDRFWGTPLPIWRCADGHLQCVGSLAELSAAGRPRRQRPRPPPAGHRRGRLRLPGLRRRGRRCLGRRLGPGRPRAHLGGPPGPPGRAGDRRLVRLGVDAGGPGRLSPPARLGVRLRASRPTSSPRRSTRRGAGSTRCWRSTPWSSATPPTATSCASATSSTRRAARCPSPSATSSTRGRSSTRAGRTRCAGGCSARGHRGRRPGSASPPSTRRCARCCSRCGTPSASSPPTRRSTVSTPPTRGSRRLRARGARPVGPVPAGLHGGRGHRRPRRLRAARRGHRPRAPRRRPLQLVRPAQPPALLAHRSRRPAR